MPLFSESLIQQLAANPEGSWTSCWGGTTTSVSCDEAWSLRTSNWSKTVSQWENGIWRLPPPSGPELHKRVCMCVTAAVVRAQKLLLMCWMQSYTPTQLQSRNSNTVQLFQADISVHKPMQCMLGAFQHIYVCNPMIMNDEGIHYNLKIKTAMTKIPQTKKQPSKWI